MALNHRIDKTWIGQGLEGSCYVIIWGLSWYLRRRSEENHERPDWDSNRTCPKQKFEVLPLNQPIQILRPQIHRNPSVICGSEGKRIGKFRFPYWTRTEPVLLRFSAEARNSSIQNVSRTHAAFYPVGTGGFLPQDKATGNWNWPLTSIQWRG
jgi:hypothetical protein